MSAFAATSVSATQIASVDASESARSIVITHGIDSNGTDLDRLCARLSTDGFHVYKYVYSPSDGTGGLEAPARGMAEFVESNVPKDARFSVVAFSMGGLISRWYLDVLGGAARTDRFVTISSPHNGSTLGYLRLNDGGRDLRPGSDFIRKLEAHRGPIERGEIDAYTFWTPLDLMIMPAKSSVVPWAKSRKFIVPAHPLMVRDPGVADALVSVLKQPLAAIAESKVEIR
jgi:triacylglycerol esterase/lipase EstA (alpha/beta hydrolase family)